MELEGRSGIITGAGSGIGRELARRIGERQGTLLLVGRRADRLDETAALVEAAGGRAHSLALDITTADAPDRILTEARRHLGSVDLLINNAGNVRAGRLEATDVDDIRAMIDLDLTAPILLSRAALPDLRASAANRPSILLTIASGIALVPLPFYTTYAAVKSGVAAFGHALRRELVGSGVHVATAYPGATATDMMATSDAGEDLGFGRRETSDLVDDILRALADDEHEINTSLPSRRTLQELHSRSPLQVDSTLAPRLSDLEAAVGAHRSI